MYRDQNRSQSKEQLFRTATQTRKEDEDIHPRELSGDQNEQQSVLATYANDSKANFLLTVTTIIKTTIGSGIIALPYTISTLGYLFAPMLFIMFFALNQFASVLLLKNKNLSKHSNYSTIMHYIWPNDASQIFGAAIIFVDNFGVCILEFILIKSSLRKIAVDVSGDPTIVDNFYLSEWFIVIVVGAIEFPFVLIKKIENLRVFAFVGVVGIVVFIFGVVAIYVTNTIDGYNFFVMRAFPQNWFTAASSAVNIVLAFDFQTNFFPIYKSMRDVNDKKFAKACLLGIIGCAIPYLTVGFLGYSLVGDSNANFLQSIRYNETNKVFFFITNLSYLFSLLFAIVLLFFSSRNNFISIVNTMRKRMKRKESDKLFSEQSEDADTQIQKLTKEAKLKKANKVYYICTVILYVIMLVLSIFLENIGLIFNFLGAVCQSLLAVLLPCIFYVMLIRRLQQQKRFTYYLAIAILLIMTPYCVFSIVASYLPNN